MNKIHDKYLQIIPFFIQMIWTQGATTAMQLTLPHYSQDFGNDEQLFQQAAPLVNLALITMNRVL